MQGDGFYKVSGNFLFHLHENVLLDQIMSGCLPTVHLELLFCNEERKDSCPPGGKSAVTRRTLQMCVCGLNPRKSHTHVPWRELCIPDDTQIPGPVSACFIYRQGAGLPLPLASAPFSPDPATWGEQGSQLSHDKLRSHARSRSDVYKNLKTL